MTTLKKIRANQKGFTLVELIVVVAILGVLAAVAVPNYMNYLYKTRISTDIDTARAVLNVARTMYMTGTPLDEVTTENALKEADLTGKPAAMGGAIEDVLGDIDTATDKDDFSITVSIPTGDDAKVDSTKWEITDSGKVTEHAELPVPKKS